ncbi:MAG: hypothetical protein WCS86_01000 [Candidatus Paceibacterota bacterium]|jgi:D-alanyl-D-alanine carboxypeptidase
MKKIFKENNVLFFILCVLLLEAVLFFIGNNKLDNNFKKEENDIAKAQTILSNVSLQAKAFSIYDETLHRKIYGRNDEAGMPIASIAKIMTVATALSEHKMDDIVLVSLNAIRQEGDYGFIAGEKFKISDLAKFTLIGSANDGAYTLAENSDHLLQKMNEKAQKIGMKNAVFLNFTGLDINNKLAGAIASAEDVNIMSLYALKAYPEIFSASILPEINIKSELGINHNIKNTNIILDKIPDILFSKTGYTPLAGGNLVVIYKNKNGHEIAITVLGSTMEGRFIDIEKIIDVLYNI